MKWVRLRNTQASHEAFSLVFGNGDYKGRFVITGLTATGRDTDTSGTLLAVDASINLREFTGDPAQPLAPAVRPAGSIAQVPAKGNTSNGSTGRCADTFQRFGRCRSRRPRARFPRPARCFQLWQQSAARS